ncbi:hypothetical protein [Absidia glauca]|uniref:EF-hand domain-containing protein n=1 Tax=Absidia glauca TaxID=4829 RepID=A0A163JEX0_ABSGL|nr:hypothetical protein [Absidia glauca]
MSYRPTQYNQQPPPPQYGTSPAQQHQYGSAPPPPQGQQQQQGTTAYGYSQQSGNYGQPPPPPPAGPPPGTNAQLWTWFKAVDADNSGQLTVDELQRALINGDWSPFNIETVRTMVNMFDADNSGTINFDEFSGLWNYIEEWKRCFQTFDRDGSGSVDRSEMHQALKAFGFNVSEKFVATLVQKFDRYGTTSQSRTAAGGNVTFDNFVQACVTVKTLTDSFRAFDTDQDGWVQINYEQFLDLVVRQHA